MAPRRPSRGRAARASPEQIAAWQAFARAFAAAGRAQEAALAGTHLDAAEYDVLLTLAQAPPEGVRPSELVERVLLTKSGVTRLADRLERRGLIERHACPSDRRGQYVALTPLGRRTLRRAAPALTRRLGEIMGALSGSELAGLARSATRITEAAAGR